MLMYVDMDKYPITGCAMLGHFSHVLLFVTLYTHCSLTGSSVHGIL